MAVDAEKAVQALADGQVQFILVGVDVLGEVAGGGNFEELLPHSVEVKAFERTLLVVGLERLIQLKRAAGRVKDLLVVGELQALLEERRRMEREA